jgi:deoxyribodipyrimidine photo-lyase
MDNPTTWTASRAAGLERLAGFVPRAGADYRKWRNYDLGPDRRANVSGLSPYLTHRLIREREVAAAVLARHSFSAAEKFLQEVCWRTYWKGWLEMRPRVWCRYRSTLSARLEAMVGDARLEDGFAAATGGGTGIECFDAWANELITTGYLHNHARMWFASIWIFTLGLPWQLGADFFYRHLLDGDPASNTLSWRWVAGLQTRGKHYLARPANIAKYTGGRFAPAAGLNTRAAPIESGHADKPEPLQWPARPAGQGRCGLLLLEHDLHPESLGIGRVHALAGCTVVDARSPLPVSAIVRDFASAALNDALERGRAFFDLATSAVTRLPGPEEIVEWAAGNRLGTVICAHAPIGPARECLDRLEQRLEETGIGMWRITRPWDRSAWPHATHGFFRFRKHIPALLEANAGLFDREPGQPAQQAGSR